MALKIPPIEECTQRWVDGNNQYLDRIAAQGGTHQQVAAAIGWRTDNVSTLVAAKGSALTHRIKSRVHAKLGWTPGMLVRDIPLRDGWLLTGPAVESDIPDYLRSARAAAVPLPVKRPDMQHMEPYRCKCEDCGVLFIAARPYRRFCDTCRLKRRAIHALARGLDLYKRVGADQERCQESSGCAAPSDSKIQEAELLLAGVPPEKLPKQRAPKGSGHTRKRGRFYHVTWWENGKHHEESSRCTDPAEARAYLRLRIDGVTRVCAFHTITRS